MIFFATPKQKYAEHLVFFRVLANSFNVAPVVTTSSINNIFFYLSWNIFEKNKAIFNIFLSLFKFKPNLNVFLYPKNHRLWQKEADQ